MKKRTLFLLFIILLFTILIPSGAVFAGTAFDTVVQSGETHNEDIVLLDGDLVIEADATVNASITIFSGDATIAGTVNGDVVLFDGDLDAASTAVINGECFVFSGTITDDTAAGLGCTNFEEAMGAAPSAAIPSIPPVPRIPYVGPGMSEPSGMAKFFGSVGGAIFRSIILGLIAFAVATLFPSHFTQVKSAVQQKPVASGTVGFLTFLVIPVLLLIVSPILALLVLVCGLGILLTLALVFGIVSAIALGWFAVGDMVGKRMADWLNLKNRTLPMTAAIGTAVLTLGFGLLGAIPYFIGVELAVFIISCVGLGSVILTKFGTKPYPPLVSDSIQILDSAENNDKVAAAIKTLPDESDTLS